MKETITTVLVRLDERVKNFIEQNDKSHKEILTSVKDLSNHVNHEADQMEKRVKILEDGQLTDKSKYQGRIQLFKWLSIGLSLALGIITILTALGRL